MTSDDFEFEHKAAGIVGLYLPPSSRGGLLCGWEGGDPSARPARFGLALTSAAVKHLARKLKCYVRIYNQESQSVD